MLLPKIALVTLGKSYSDEIRLFSKSPISEFLLNLAIAISEGQSILDEECLNIAEEMAETEVDVGDIIDDSPVTVNMNMLELGFTPTFYRFVDTTVEVRVSVSSTYKESEEVSKESKIKASSVDAVYSNKYNYAVEAASIIKTKIIPVPAPSLLDEMIKANTEEL